MSEHYYNGRRNIYVHWRGRQLKGDIVKIEKTWLGTYPGEDDFGAWVSLLGGVGANHRVDQATFISSELLKGFLDVAGVKTWEELPGKYVVMLSDGGIVYGVQNLLDETKFLMNRGEHQDGQSPWDIILARFPEERERQKRGER